METIYEERLSSNVTTGLFVALTLVFGALFAWRVLAVGFRFVPVVFLILSLLFLFYTINYRMLIVRFNEQGLLLRFGIIPWRIPFSNMQSCGLDEVVINRIGGAGIHFMLLDKRYRANYNFLDLPRVLVRLKERQGLVWDVSFSTRQPDEVMHIIQEKAVDRTA